MRCSRTCRRSRSDKIALRNAEFRHRYATCCFPKSGDLHYRRGWTPELANAEGLRHIAQPPLPGGPAGTLATRYQWVERIVETALEGNGDTFILALVIDGATESIEHAPRLATELLDTHAQHLPWYQFHVQMS